MGERHQRGVLRQMQAAKSKTGASRHRLRYVERGEQRPDRRGDVGHRQVSADVAQSVAANEHAAGAATICVADLYCAASACARAAASSTSRGARTGESQRRTDPCGLVARMSCNSTHKPPPSWLNAMCRLNAHPTGGPTRPLKSRSRRSQQADAVETVVVRGRGAAARLIALLRPSGLNPIDQHAVTFAINGVGLVRGLQRTEADDRRLLIAARWPAGVTGRPSGLGAT